MSMETTDYKLYDWSIANGAVDQADLGYCNHRRGQNWVATVKFSPMEKGGLDRQFWHKGSGAWRAVPESIAIGDIIEISCQYYTSGGNCDYDRRYWRVYKVGKRALSLARVKKPGARTISTSEFRKAIRQQLKREHESVKVVAV